MRWDQTLLNRTFHFFISLISSAKDTPELMDLLDTMDTAARDDWRRAPSILVLYSGTDCICFNRYKYLKHVSMGWGQWQLLSRVQSECSIHHHQFPIDEGSMNNHHYYYYRNNTRKTDQYRVQDKKEKRGGVTVETQSWPGAGLDGQSCHHSKLRGRRVLFGVGAHWFDVPLLWVVAQRPGQSWMLFSSSYLRNSWRLWRHFGSSVPCFFEYLLVLHV